MRNHQPTVSVIIPTYRDWERLGLCLDALAKQTYPKSDFEVIIVNNDPGSPCPYELPASNMMILEEAKSGSYAARNRGIRNARGLILAFTDSDCRPRTNWLEEGTNFLLVRKDRKCIAVGRIDLFYRDPGALTVAEVYEKAFGFPYQKSGTSEELNTLVTANVFVPRSAFTEVGFFEEKVMSGGDGLFAKNAMSMNYRLLYNPQCIVYHPARHSLRELIRKRKRVLGGHISRSVYTGGRKRISAVAIEIFNYWEKSLRQAIAALKTKRLDTVGQRIKLVSGITSLLMALTWEGIVILAGGKAKR